MRIEVHVRPDLPAFAGYAAGSVSRGEPVIVLNIEAFVRALDAGALEPEDMAHAMAETLVHECFHAIEEFWGLAFSEDRVEGWIDEFIRRPRGMVEVSRRVGWWGRVRRRVFARGGRD